MKIVLFFLLIFLNASTQGAQGEGKMTKNQQKKESYKAELVFLSLSEKLDLDWVKKQLRQKGFSPSDYQIKPSSLYPGEQAIISSQLELVKLVNRMRAIAGGPSKHPYVLLKLKDPGSSRESHCVTRNWAKLKENLQWDEVEILVQNWEGLEEVKSCLVEGNFSSLYKDKNAEDIRSTFFEPNGALKIRKYPGLKEDREFIFFLIEKGFFPVMGDEEGYLVLQ